jgi:site-specific DNA-methyltransferase (adenine-specific)
MSATRNLFEAQRYERLACADAVAWLRTIGDESVDLGITDPAYESLEKHRAVGTTTRLKVSAGSSNQWFEIFPNARFPELFAEYYRVLKPNAHLYVYCDPETAFIAKPIGEAAGFKFWKPLVFDKVTIGMGYHYRARYECIMFFEKGKRMLNDLGVSDIITCKRVRGLVCDSCENRNATPRDTSRSSSEDGGDSSTSSSGSATVGPSRRATNSTTRTRSKRTTSSTTSSCSTRLATSESTADASSETAFGGSPAGSAERSSQSLPSTGTSPRTVDGQSSGAAGLVTSEPSSSASEPSACPECGGQRRRVWPTEKPEAVSRVLIEQSSKPGELVVDCFMGSGSVGAAAVKAGRRFAGCDLSPSAVELATARIEAAARA